MRVLYDPTKNLGRRRVTMTRVAEQRPTSHDALAALDGVEERQMELLGDAVVSAVRAFEADVAAGRVPLERSRRRPSH